MQMNLATEALKDIYFDRKARNTSYSIASFARDFGVSQSFISMIFSGARRPNLKLILQVCEIQDLEEDERRVLINCVLENQKYNTKHSLKYLTGTEAKDSYQIKMESFRLVSKWYHIPLLEIVGLSDFKNDEFWISKKLGISIAEVKDGIQRLINLNLLSKGPNGLQRTSTIFNVPTKVSDGAIRSFHSAMIEKGKGKLNETSQEDFDKREISSVTIKVSPAKLKLAKTKIKKFKEELIELLQDDNYTDLYQMNIQFFSLLK